MVAAGLPWNGVGEGVMCSESSDAREGPNCLCGVGVAMEEGRASGSMLEVGEELVGMQRRSSAGRDSGVLVCGAVGQEAPGSQGILGGCGCARVGEKRNLSSQEPHRKDEDKGRPASPQDSCSVAEGILMHQSKKQRILRRRVTFHSESRMRVIARVAQYYVHPDFEGAEEGAARDEDEEDGISHGCGEEGGGAGAAEPKSEGDDSSTGAPEEEGQEIRASSPAGSPDAADAGGQAPSMSECGEGGAGGEDEAEMSWEEELELCSGGDRGDEPVETKTNDGPSLINVITQSLIIGMVERRVRNVGDVLHTLRKCVVPGSFAVEEGEENKAGDLAGGAADKQSVAHPSKSSSEASSSSSEEESGGSDVENKRPKCVAPRRVPLRPEMIVSSSVFDTTRDHVKVLLGRINNNGRASLLPSTAQIGAPFVPALEFLVQSLQEAQARNEADRDRYARLRQMQQKQQKRAASTSRLALSPRVKRGNVAAIV